MYLNHGYRSITEDTALRLAKFFGIEKSCEKTSTLTHCSDRVVKFVLVIHELSGSVIRELSGLFQKDWTLLKPVV